MKKLLLIAVFAICGLGTVNAQGFSAGVTLGIPVGDAGNVSSFVYGADVLYMFNADEEFTYGVATGYQTYVGKTISIPGLGGGLFDFEVPNSNFIPLAAAGRYVISEKFSAGADIGYAINTTSGGTSGFYYRPMLVYNMSETMRLNASYSGISADGSTLSSIGLGIMFDF